MKIFLKWENESKFQRLKFWPIINWILQRDFKKWAHVEISQRIVFVRQFLTHFSGPIFGSFGSRGRTYLDVNYFQEHECME